MQVLVARDGEDTPSICIDTAGVNHLLSNARLKRGEADCDTNCKRQAIVDRGNELLASDYEAIQVDIAACKKALDEAKPILQAVQDSVKGITKQPSDAIPALPKPRSLLVCTAKAGSIMVGTDQSCESAKKLLKTIFIIIIFY